MNTPSTTMSTVRVHLETMILEPIEENTLLVLVNRRYFIPVTPDNLDRITEALTSEQDVVLEARKAARKLPFFALYMTDEETSLILTFDSGRERTAFRNYFLSSPELKHVV